MDREMTSIRARHTVLPVYLFHSVTVYLYLPLFMVVLVVISGAAVCVSVCSNEMTTDLDILHGSS